MATYYVRASMGNDGNTGLSPAQAWLTVDHAANQVAAADTVWIGSGVYRELVTMDTSGTSGNEISFIGDIDGVQTGDPGPVIISGHDNTTSAPARANAMNMGVEEFITWQRVIFDGGSTAAVQGGNGAANLAFEEVKFLDCVFCSGSGVGDYSVYLDIQNGAGPTGDGFLFDRCVFLMPFLVEHTGNEVAHIDIKAEIRNCLSIGSANQTDGMFFWASAGGTFSIGGIDITNCTFVGWDYSVHGSGFDDVANQLRVLNSVHIACRYAAYETGSTNNAVYEDYNWLWACSGVISGDVQQGGNSDSLISCPLVGGIADLMFYNLLGWSPWKPWELISFQDITMYQAPGVDAASATYAPAADVYGNPRPMLRNADDIGLTEARARVQEDTVAGEDIAKFLGAGYHDMMIAVDAALTTVEVVGRYDANYTGSLPILRVYNIPGVADQSDVMTAAAATDETLSCVFTPTSAGYCRVRLESRDTSANGEAYFRDVEVT